MTTDKVCFYVFYDGGGGVAGGRGGGANGEVVYLRMGLNRFTCQITLVAR